MNTDTYQRASELASNIDRLERFLREIEWSLDGIKLAPFGGHGKPVEIEAIYADVKPLVVARLRGVLADWQAEFEAL